MAETMLEVVSVAGIGDDLDGEVMDIDADDTGMDRCLAGFVRPADDGVDLLLLICRLADAHGPCHIRMVVMVAGTIVHDDEVALLDAALPRLGMRVGTVRAACDDRVERERIGTAVEHRALKLRPDLELVESRLDVAADVLEGSIRDGLGMAHEGDLFGVLHDTQRRDRAMHARQEACRRLAAKLCLERIEEGKVCRVLDCDDTGMGLPDQGGCPGRMAHGIHIELPVRILAKAILECAEVARIRMEPLALAGHEGRMCDLVVERALGSCEPAQIRIVAQHDCVISILLHEGTKACNTRLSHFLICHSKRSFPIECASN